MPRRHWTADWLAIAVALAALSPAADRRGARARARSRPACVAVAAAQLDACANDVRDNFFMAKAVCLNGPEGERDACIAEAKVERDDGGDVCREQRDARRDLCDELGEDRYAPDFDPAHFDADFTALTRPNPYFPLGIGHRWQYVGGDETVTVEVLARTKLIEGVTCIVVNDRVEVGGRVEEDTDDWFAQRKDGGVVYCGESSQSLATFAGDVPAEPELVDVEGSWKTGREGALPGTIFLASPAVGSVYRQEWFPGTAEDAARVLSISYALGDAELDQFVPQSLATLLCGAHDCVVTAEFSPLDPGSVERKYYAKGLGLFLEVHVDSGETTRLVACNFDARCGLLPP